MNHDNKFSGLLSSPYRREILNILIPLPHIQLNKLKKYIKLILGKCNEATLYRHLDVLADAGLITHFNSISGCAFVGIRPTLPESYIIELLEALSCSAVPTHGKGRIVRTKQPYSSPKQAYDIENKEEPGAGLDSLTEKQWDIENYMSTATTEGSLSVASYSPTARSHGKREATDLNGDYDGKRLCQNARQVGHNKNCSNLEEKSGNSPLQKSERDFIQNYFSDDFETNHSKER